MKMLVNIDAQQFQQLDSQSLYELAVVSTGEIARRLATAASTSGDCRLRGGAVLALRAQKHITEGEQIRCGLGLTNICEVVQR